MRQRRGSTDGLLLSGSDRGHVLDRQQALEEGEEEEQQQQSPWQTPGDVITPVLELLLSMEDGARWLRAASHVCSYWRAAAQDILLGDTAISKPPLEDFRAIGTCQSPVRQPKAPKTKADTNATQAAMVVVEASASTGVEAVSKPRFDGPPRHQVGPGSAAAADGFTVAYRRWQRFRTAAAAQRAGRAGGSAAWRHALLDGQPHAAALMQLAPVAPAGPAAAAGGQQQAGAEGAAAHPPAEPAEPAASPSQQQHGAVAAPRGSIQSDVAAAAAHRGRLTSESDSDGVSTLAQAGPRRQRRRHVTFGQMGGPSNDPSVELAVEQPQHAAPPLAAPQQQQQRRRQQQQQQQQQGRRGSQEAVSPSSTATQGRKRTAAAAAAAAWDDGQDGRPHKRRQAGQQQQQQQHASALTAGGAALAPAGPSLMPAVPSAAQPASPGLRGHSRGTRTGLRSQPIAKAAAAAAEEAEQAAREASDAPRPSAQLLSQPLAQAAAVAAAEAVHAAQVAAGARRPSVQPPPPANLHGPAAAGALRRRGREEGEGAADGGAHLEQQPMVAHLPGSPHPHQQAKEDSELSGSYYEAEGGMEVDEVEQQRQGQSQRQGQQERKEGVARRLLGRAAAAARAPAPALPHGPHPSLHLPPREQGAADLGVLAEAPAVRRAPAGAVQAVMGMLKRFVGL